MPTTPCSVFLIGGRGGVCTIFQESEHAEFSLLSLIVTVSFEVDLPKVAKVCEVCAIKS